MSPSEICLKWQPLLRRLAWQHAIQIDDLRQEAWLIAAELLANPPSNGCPIEAAWLKKIEWGAGELACRGSESEAEFCVSPDCICDDPADILLAAQEVSRGLDELLNEIELPRTSNEIAEARNVSKRQGRRDRRKLEMLANIQRDLFGGLGGLAK